jgi:hypothetical protein
VRFFGETRSRAHAPADKPRDAEAMEAAVAGEVDAEAAKRRAEAGTKPKRPESFEPDAADAVGEAGRRRG